MKKNISRRSAILAGANIAAVAGATSAVAAAPKPTAYKTALGVPENKLSPDDYAEITQLYGRYCHELNRDNMEAFASLYVEDGEFYYGHGPNKDKPAAKGHEALRTTGAGGHLRHFQSNIILAKTPEGAKGSCYLILYDTRTKPTSFVGTAIYDDWLVKTAEGWRFKKRVLTRDDNDEVSFNRP